MGDLGQLGVSLHDLAGSSAANENVNPHRAMNVEVASEMEDDDLLENYRAALAEHDAMMGNYGRLHKMKTDPSSLNYDEASVRQRGIDNEISQYDKRIAGHRESLRTFQDEVNSRGDDFAELARSQGLHDYRTVPSPADMIRNQGANPMTPLARGPQMPTWHPEQPSGLPRELTFGRPANENEPPVE
jgi:hypothetical protein